MAVTSKNILKDWFKRGKKPLESQFADWLDSYYHKDEKITAAQIDGLEGIINEKADSADIDEIRADLADLHDGKVNVLHDLTWTQPIGTDGKYTKMLEIPANCEVVLNVTKVTKGYSQMNTVWLSNYYTASLTTMYDWDLRTRNGGGRAISLMIPSITIDMGVSVSFSIQVLHYNGKTPIRLYSDLSESSFKNASVSANVLWRDTPSVSDEVTVIDLNDNPCELFDGLLVSSVALDMSQGREYLIKDFENGNNKGHRVGLVGIIPSNVEENCIYRFTATMDIPIIIFSREEGDYSLVTKEKLFKGDTLVVTTYSGGWIYSIMQAPITSKDGSVDISFEEDVPDLSVPVSAIHDDCDDAATAYMGNLWRTPTKEDFEELIENTTQEKLYDDDGHFLGVKLTSKENGNHIILPKSGFKSECISDSSSVCLMCATKYVIAAAFSENDDDDILDFDVLECNDINKYLIVIMGVNVRGVTDYGMGGVDLGFGVNWATCNVGSKDPLKPGIYFSWGESSPKSRYAEYNHRYVSGVRYDGSLLMSKYEYDGLTVLENDNGYDEKGSIHLQKVVDKYGEETGKIKPVFFRNSDGDVYAIQDQSNENQYEIDSKWFCSITKDETEDGATVFEINPLTPYGKAMTYSEKNFGYQGFIPFRYDDEAVVITKREDAHIGLTRILSSGFNSKSDLEDGRLLWINSELDISFVTYYWNWGAFPNSTPVGVPFKVRANTWAQVIYMRGAWYPFRGCESPQYNTVCKLYDKDSFETQTKNLGGGRYVLLVPDYSSWVVEISYCPSNVTFVGIGLLTEKFASGMPDPGILDMSTCTIINKGTGGFSFSAPYGDIQSGDVRHPIYGNVNHAVNSDSITKLMHYDGVWYLNDY